MDETLVEKDPEGHEHLRPDADVRAGESIRPIDDLVVFRREKAPETFRGSNLINPATHRKKCTRGHVVAAGPRCTEVSPGDVIHVHTWMGEPVTFEEHGDCFVVHEDEIDGVEE